MAIKISGSTIIDDSRQLLNVGVSTFTGDINVTGVGKSIKIGPWSCQGRKVSSRPAAGMRQVTDAVDFGPRVKGLRGPKGRGKHV